MRVALPLWHRALDTISEAFCAVLGNSRCGKKPYVLRVLLSACTKRALQPVAERQPLVGCMGALDPGARGVPSEHLRRAPTGEAHEVLFLAPVDEPPVRSGVPKAVWVDA